MDGTGGEQQLRNIGRVPDTTEGEAPWAAERDLGQSPGVPSASSGVARRCGSSSGHLAWGCGW